MESSININIFTLNCWYIPVISKNRTERIQALVKYLLGSFHDIVCLQEIWSEIDYLYLKNSLKIEYSFSHYFYSGVLGSGLCVFSKWPIQDVFFHQWPLNGYIHKIHHGDWFGGKGVGLCRIKHLDNLINVYCTHLHAQYHEDDIYLAHRISQAHSTAEFIKLTSSSADVSILAGDLNTGPGDLAFRIITQVPALLDPYDMKCEGTNPSVKKASGTSDHINNSYSDPKATRISPNGKRIDHILLHLNKSWQANIKNFGNPLEDRVPKQPFSYSDHNAVCLDVCLRSSKTSGEQKLYADKDYSSLCNTTSEAIKVFQEATVTISKTKTLYLTVGGILLMFLIDTIGLWPKSMLHDATKLVITGLSFYCLFMGSLWNKIEINSLKAGLRALEILRSSITK